MSIKTHYFGGGQDPAEDIEALNNNIQIAVGTPGRITHMMQNPKFRCSDIKMFIIDEADEMLSRGFAEQLVTIFKQIPKTV